jgi:integration host factor subunit beta
MTKADLIDELSKVANLTKKQSEAIVDTVFDSITEALARGDKVELRGFGSFRIRRRRARRGRNPKTGTLVSVPPKRVPFFKVGKQLRERVNAERRCGEGGNGGPGFPRRGGEGARNPRSPGSQGVASRSQNRPNSPEPNPAGGGAWTLIGRGISGLGRIGPPWAGSPSSALSI